MSEFSREPVASATDTREFPGFTNVYEGEAELPVEQVSNLFDRRQFLGATTIAALAAASGCRRPDLRILPYSQTPEHTTPGLPTFYATSMPKPGGCFPILVETHEGRPTKIEGHPTHPASMGGCDAFTQASIYDLYSPDRSKEVLKRNSEGKLVPSTWEAFDAFAASHFAELKKKEGEGLAFLLEDNPSPALRLLREHMKERFPKAVWCVYEPIDESNGRKGRKFAFPIREKRPGPKEEIEVEITVDPTYHFAKAKRILSLDCDFLGIDGNTVANARAFAELRRQRDAAETNRLYQIESTYSVTGAMADHRLCISTAYLQGYILSLAKEIANSRRVALPATLLAAFEPYSPSFAGVDERWIKEVAADLVAFAGSSLVLTNNRQGPVVHALCAFINEVLGNVGKTVEYRNNIYEENEDIGMLDYWCTSSIRTLLIVGGNPVQNGWQFPEHLANVANVIRLGLHFDETSERATWHLPMSHYLESWADAETSDGTYCCIQPMIAPLHAGRSMLELFIQVSAWEKAANYSDAKAKVYQLLQESFKKRTSTEDELSFKRFVQEGYVGNSARPAILHRVDAQTLTRVVEVPRQPYRSREGEFLVSLQPDYRVGDGRFAWNAWLMELPDPITKLVWDNAALVGPKTAEMLGVKNGDVVEIADEIRSLKIPVLIAPGQADQCITIHFGYGKMRMTRTEGGGGFDISPLRIGNSYSLKAKVTKTSETYDLVTTQEHGTIPVEKRHEIIREYSIHDRLAPGLPGEAHDHSKVTPGKPGANHDSNHDDPKSRFQWGYEQSKYKDANDDTRRVALQQAQDVAVPQQLDGDMQWGMVIDLNTCTGCSACVIACQAENNIPVVGKNEVKMNREMHWISVHRYFTSTKGEVRGGLEQSPADDTGIVSQPMMCQHCEAAPCESVCPVNAAVHSPEGLNLQVYNRCIGTRYCSNNCPYKARKFNWFDFNKRRLDELRVPTPFSEAGMPETLKMQKNPEVTVRMRGVMEKCTYCIQRIERARIGAKVLAIKAGADKPDALAPANPYEAGYDIQMIDGTPRIVVPDGIIKTACEQACPSQAITFGNVRDKNSRVYKLKNTGDDYLVLGSINTKPRTSYLPRLRNPNPKMKND